MHARRLQATRIGRYAARMPGSVIQVERDAKVGRLPRRRRPAVVRDLFATGWRFLRNLRGFATGRNRRDFLVQVPEERIDHPDAFRGMPVLVERADGTPRCVGCRQCAVVCPPGCIDVVAGGSTGVEAPRVFEIDMARCMFCGLCEEVCPETAVVMSREVEIASYDRESLVFGMKELLVPEALLERRIAYLRGGAVRAGRAVSTDPPSEGPADG
jgi:NADH-quinone oxidoreductase subunit I